MKRLIPFLIVTICSSLPLLSQNVNIPDPAFLYALIEEGVDANKDSLISVSEAEAITNLSITSGTIKNLTGIEAFKNLISLECSDNQITSLDVSGNTTLELLKCEQNLLTSLNISKNLGLEKLYCFDNSITSLDVTANESLEILYCHNNQMTTLDVSNNSLLGHLSCENNSLTSLMLPVVSEVNAILYVSCDGNNLTGLDASMCSNLYSLKCTENELNSLDVTNCTLLEWMECGRNQLTTLDLSTNLSLGALYCGGNPLTSLDLSANTALEELWLGNPITGLDISSNTKISFLNISHMATLHQVCVWTAPFPPSGVTVYDNDSPNVFYTSDCTSGLEEHKSSILSIQPNPAMDVITIQANGYGPLLIEINSLNGQLLYSKQMTEPTHQIDFSEYQQGTYLITVRARDFSKTEKIVKQ